MNGINLNSVRREASGHCRNNTRDYLKDKINELAINNRNKNVTDVYRGMMNLRRATNIEITW
jgi:hypothetical protein